MDIPRTYDAKGEFTDTYPTPEGGWVCFHCGQRFYHQAAARRHFGATPDEITRCIQQPIRKHQ